MSGKERRKARRMEQVRRICDRKLENITSPTNRGLWEAVRDHAVQRAKMIARGRS